MMLWKKGSGNCRAIMCLLLLAAVSWLFFVGVTIVKLANDSSFCRLGVSGSPWWCFNIDSAEKPNSPSVAAVNSDIVILLQRSPVQPSHQIRRLRGIDRSWARWTRSGKQHGAAMLVLAAIDETVTVLNDKIFDNLKLLKLSSYQTEELIGDATGAQMQQELTAFERMVLSFSDIVSRPDCSAMKWLIMANDHTFIVPQNLRGFLSGLDHDLFVYTGNELCLSYRGTTVPFASGGAGAVVSNVLLRALTVIWFCAASATPEVHTNQQLQLWQLLGRRQSERLSELSHVKIIFNSEANDEVSLQVSPMNPAFPLSALQCILMILVRPTRKTDARSFPRFCVYLCRQHASLSAKECAIRLKAVTAVKVPLSKRSYFLISSTPQRDDLHISILNAFGNRMPLIQTTASYLQKACIAQDKWTNDNPGIVLAYCVAGVLQTRFTPSNQCTSERFNVYGTVRSVLGDVDSWYRTAKGKCQEYHSLGFFNSSSGTTEFLRASSCGSDEPVIVSEVVSFHYVDSAEAAVLYSSLNSGNIRNMDMWPRRRVDLGHYSRAPIDESEEKLLREFLFRNFSMHPSDDQKHEHADLVHK